MHSGDWQGLAGFAGLCTTLHEFLGVYSFFRGLRGFPGISMNLQRIARVLRFCSLFFFKSIFRGLTGFSRVYIYGFLRFLRVSAIL